MLTGIMSGAIIVLVSLLACAGEIETYLRDRANDDDNTRKGDQA